MSSDGLVSLDPQKLEARRLQLGKSRKEIAQQSGLNARTVYRLLRGESGRVSSARDLVEFLTGSPDLRPFLPNASQNSDGHPAGSETVLQEWEVDEVLTPWVTASNELQYQLCRLRHRYVDRRMGRGKRYDLTYAATRDEERMQEQLVRHPKVCEAIGPHPNIPENLSVAPDETGRTWWVVDRWIDGPTLAEELGRGPLAPCVAARVMQEIGAGLKALHKAGIIRRELSPNRVLLEEPDKTAVLTDFELAKLLDGSPTVSKEWREDAYRAPEVGSQQVDERADVYSWGRILVHAVAGELPAAGLEEDILQECRLPKAVHRAALECVAPYPDDRPKSMSRVLRRIDRWC